MVAVTTRPRPRIVMSPADVERLKAARCGTECQAPTVPQPSRIQAIHAGKEGFILRGTRSETFWEW
jgi:hypothetical protein